MQLSSILVFSGIVSGGIAAFTLPYADLIIDGALSVTRELAILQPDLGTFKVPHNVSVSSLTLSNVILKNMTNIYRRSNNATMQFGFDGFKIDTDLRLDNFTTAASYVFDQWPISSSGDMETFIDRMEMTAAFKLDPVNLLGVDLLTINVTDIGSIYLRKLSGSDILVRTAVGALINSGVMKEVLKGYIQENCLRYFRKILGRE